MKETRIIKRKKRLINLNLVEIYKPNKDIKEIFNMYLNH